MRGSTCPRCSAEFNGVGDQIRDQISPGSALAPLVGALGIAEAAAFQSAARRLISRLCAEQAPSMEQVRKSADELL